MEHLLTCYSNLISTKCLQEVIATDLRELTSDWIISYEEEELVEVERERTAADEVANELDDLDFYKQIDEILAKANESIKKDLTIQAANSKKQSTNPPVKPTKAIPLKSTLSSQPTKKSQTNLNQNKNLNSKSAAPQPVYLKAPYKTQVVKPSHTKQVIKPSQQPIIKKAQSTDNLIANKIEVEPVKKKSIESVPAISSKIITTETRLVVKSKPASFKEMAMNLYLSPKLEYLTVKTTDLALKIAKKKRKQTARQSFLNKLSENFLNESQPNVNLYKTEIIFKKAQHLLTDHLFRIDAKNRVTSYLKLKMLLTYFESFSDKIQQLVPESALAIRADDSIIDISLYDSACLNFMPITYQNSSDLIRLNELKCDLAELEFRILLLNFIKVNILNDLKNNQANIEFLKLVYSFISNNNKKLIIAS